MKEVKVVIGKNFGDEGKGAMVHRLCVGREAIVVRHNGGAQAGHTVEDGDFRFVFHQLGSGSLAGCHTFWSRTFLPDLLKLDEEMEGFLAEVERSAGGQVSAGSSGLAGMLTGRLGQGTQSSTGQRSCMVVPSKIYAHPDCACTVIYDVLLNSLTETLRGSAKHGSCGMGIYEATVRVQEKAYTLRLKDFAVGNVADIAGKMRRIQQEYTLPRLQKLREEYGNAFNRPEICQWVELIEDDNVLWNAAEQMWVNFHKYVELKDWQAVKAEYDVIVFENAQGLMLDRENVEYYPHLTPSYTGLHNVSELFGDNGDAGSRDVVQKTAQATRPVGQEYEPREALKAGVGENATFKPEGTQIGYDMEIYYVTRTYVTRHGMGRLDYECPKEAINSHMVDKTNVPNVWQDALRYAKHPMGQEFWKYIHRDLENLERLKAFANIQPIIYVNHLDETEGRVLFADGAMNLEEFAEFCKEQGIVMMHK